MKKLFTLVFTMLLGASLAFAQAGGGSTDTSKDPATTSKGKKHHKGGHHKKGKKNSGDTNTGSTNPK